MPATFLVTNTSDSGPGSLRQAILDANANTGPDTIQFNLPSSDPNFIDVDSGLTGGDPAADVWVIRPLSALPALNDPTGGTTIDGHSQTAFGGNTNPFGPEVVLDGSLAASATGLQLLSNSNGVFGLNILRFSQNGILISGGAGNVVAGNYLGTDYWGGNPLIPGTVSWWKGEGNAADLVGGNHGTLVNGATFAPGKVGQAFSFDGVDDHVRVPRAANLEPTRVTVEAWVKASDSPGIARYVVSKGANANAAASYALYTGASGGLRFYVYNPASGAVLSPDAGVGIWDGNWHHVAGTYDGAHARLYVDGVQVGTGTPGSISIGYGLPTSNDLLLGAYPSGASTATLFFKGSIDEVGVYNRALTAAEIQAIAAAGAAGKVMPSGNALNGVRLDGGAVGNTIGGTTASDRNIISGNGANGVLISDAGTANNTVAGNYIGTNAAGLGAFPNAQGVFVQNGASNNTIGGTAAGAMNLISGNTFNGVVLIDNAAGNQVLGNRIGTDLNGTLRVPNQHDGVHVLNAPNNTIGAPGAGNLISGNNRVGVALLQPGTTGTVVAANRIGTNASGTAAVANANQGVFVLSGANGNLIGTNGDGINDAAEGNLISGNGHYGVLVAGTGTSNNVVAGNRIGTNAAGTAALGNFGGVGIDDGATNNRVGTNGDGVNDAAERNLISGNQNTGLYIGGSGTNNNVVAGNYIGTNALGTLAIANGRSGVLVFAGARNNRIGGPTVSERNLVSGNTLAGIAFQHTGTTGNLAQGNWVGLNATGTGTIANNLSGIGFVDGASSNSAVGNVVSGNQLAGVAFLKFATTLGSHDNVVQGNFIGTDPSGTVPLGNNGPGVTIQDDSTGNLIGTNGDGVNDAAEGNLISGNLSDGVAIIGPGSHNNVVAGNLIGSNAAGTAALGNSGNGVLIAGANNRIGTNGDGVADAAERNVISGNGGAGVLISGTGNNNNVVAGNYIGTDVTGTLPLGNTVHGIYIFNGPWGTRIGTNGDGIADDAEGNVISANGFDGIAVQGRASGGTGPITIEQTVIAGNLIGTDVTGTVAMGNGRYGVLMGERARFNRVGTNGDGVSDAAERNVISANVRAGVGIGSTDSDGNVVAGNYIGTDVTGTAPMGNGGFGVGIGSGPRFTRVGTNGDGINDEAEGNLIAFNVGSGVVILSASPVGNSIRGNSIHSNDGLGIDLGDDGVTPNDSGDLDTGANNLQNFPVLQLAVAATATHASGSLQSAPNQTFIIDFYASAAADPSGYGEGQHWLGWTSVTTDGDGNAAFTISLPLVAPGQVLTATATDAAGNTSEFSLAAVVQPPPSISIDSVTADEGDNGTTAFVFTVTLSHPSLQTITVDFATAGGTATAGLDYVSTSGTLTFNPLEVTRTITVLVNGDTTDEFDETFEVLLSNATNATLAVGTGTGTIVNDDAPPALSITNVTAPEGNSGTTPFTFLVSLSEISGKTVTVNYATADGTATAGSDYVSASGTLTFAPGELSQPITVLVNGDTTVEPDETFTVTLSGAVNATLANGTGTGTILNDDAAAAVSLSIDDVTRFEGNSGTTEFVFTVSLSAASASTVTVRYATANGTAVFAGREPDYTRTTGTLTYAPGVTSQTITVLVNGDTTFEPDETFFVHLSGAVNATIARGSGVGTILNDDVLPELSIDDVTQFEGNSGTTAFVFTVSLSVPLAETVTVRYGTAAGTAQPAGPNADYTNVRGTLTFAPGVTTQKIIVLVNGDTLVEPDETFFVNLMQPSGAVIADGQGIGTILNDDGFGLQRFGAAVTSSGTQASLTAGELASVVDEALGGWRAAGIHPDQFGLLGRVGSEGVDPRGLNPVGIAWGRTETEHATGMDHRNGSLDGRLNAGGAAQRLLSRSEATDWIFQTRRDSRKRLPAGDMDFLDF